MENRNSRLENNVDIVDKSDKDKEKRIKKYEQNMQEPHPH
jgi:hypothetical protein